MLQRNVQGVSLLDRAAVRVARCAVRENLRAALHAADMWGDVPGDMTAEEEAAAARGREGAWSAGVAKLGRVPQWDAGAGGWVSAPPRDTVRPPPPAPRTPPPAPRRAGVNRARLDGERTAGGERPPARARSAQIPPVRGARRGGQPDGFRVS